MKTQKALFTSAFIAAFMGLSCTPTTSSDNDTVAISGVFRKENIAWTGTYGPCEVNQILTISRNGNDNANLIASYEVITEPVGGIGAPVINYVGNYNVNNCSISNTDGIIVLTYSYPGDPGGDLAIISGISGSLSGNNLTISVTRGGTASSSGTFLKQ